MSNSTKQKLINIVLGLVVFTCYAVVSDMEYQDEMDMQEYRETGKISRYATEEEK